MMVKFAFLALSSVLMLSYFANANLSQEDKKLLKSLINELSKGDEASETNGNVRNSPDSRQWTAWPGQIAKEDEVPQTKEKVRNLLDDQGSLMDQKAKKDVAPQTKEKARELSGGQKSLFNQLTKKHRPKAAQPEDKTRKLADTHGKSVHNNDGRAVWNFAAMVKEFLGVDAVKYNDYGCYCGYSNMGENVEAVDVIDECCREHDLCFGKHDDRCPDHSNYLDSYNWEKLKKGDDNLAVCVDNPNTNDYAYCQYSYCTCDLVFTRCIVENQDEYDPEYQNWSSHGWWWWWQYGGIRCINE